MNTKCPTCKAEMMSRQWKTNVTFTEVYLCGAVLKWGAVRNGPVVEAPCPSARK